MPEPTPSESFRCHACGAMHAGPAFAFAAGAPAAWAQLSETDAWPDSALGTDQCVIGNRHFFVRGLVEIPVIGREDPFAWNVWTSLSRESFMRMDAAWDDARRADEPPYFGWLSTELAPLYPSTLNLKLRVHTRPVGIRPLLELEPTEHPLAVEQRQGISLERVLEINSHLVHEPPAGLPGGPRDP